MNHFLSADIKGSVLKNGDFLGNTLELLDPGELQFLPSWSCAHFQEGSENVAVK